MVLARGAAINVTYSIADGGKRAVGFKLSDGMDVPEELETRFKFAGLLLLNTPEPDTQWCQ